jgi:polyhydroxyalkanoate synthesis regulator phasin
MAKPIKLDVLANVRGFQAGTDDVADALEKVSDSLDDVVRDGERGTDELERSFAELARDARKHGDDVGDGLGRGFKKAGAGADDFKQEANQSLRETAASISSVEDGLDAVQEIAANAFVGFGPVGAGAGLVGALGLGLVTEELRTQQQESDELRSRLTSAYAAAVEAGRDYLDEAQLIAEVNSLLFDPERADEYRRLQEEAARIGVDVETYTRAIAGDEESINVALEIGNAKRAERADWAEKNLAPERETGERIDAQGRAMDGVLDKLKTRAQLTEENKAAADLALRVTQDINTETAAGNKAAKDAVDERGRTLEEYGRKAASIPNPVLVPTIDTSKADRELSRFIARAKTPFEVSVIYKPTGGKWD